MHQRQIPALQGPYSEAYSEDGISDREGQVSCFHSQVPLIICERCHTGQ